MCARRNGALAGLGLLAGTILATGATVTVQVLSSDPKALTITVKGPGLPAPAADGTEVFKVVLGDAEPPYAGHLVQGELNKSEGQWRLDNLWPADPAVTSAAADGAAQLHRDTIELGRQAIRGVGDTLPPFALYNQNGEIIRPESLRGQRLVINFIFTRCANPNMCPANTQRMAELQKKVKAAQLDHITFVTITIDPEHDTPGALRQYADAYGLDLSNYQLLTGPADEMAETLQQFGILTKMENGQLVHTLATLIVSPEGRITYRKDSDLWSIQEFFDRLKPSTPVEKPKGS